MTIIYSLGRADQLFPGLRSAKGHVDVCLNHVFLTSGCSHPFVVWGKPDDGDMKLDTEEFFCKHCQIRIFFQLFCF